MEVADAFSKLQNPTEKVNLAFKLFSRDGVAMINFLNTGSKEIEKLRGQARDLGIVIEESLARNAETAKDGIEILSKVISINLTRAMLDIAPIITDTTGLLANFASTAGVAYEKLKLIFKGDFEFKGLSKHGLETSIKALQDAITMMQKSQESQPDTWLGNIRRKNLAKMIDEETAKLKKYQVQFDEYNAAHPHAKKPAPFPSFEADNAGTNKGLEKKNELEKKGLEIKKKYASAESLYNEQLKELNALLQAGVINQNEFSQASLDAYNEMLDKSTNWVDGIKRGFRDYAAEGGDAAKSFETATKNALKSSEDAFVSFVKTGKIEAGDLFTSIADEALRLAYKMAVINPLSSIFEGVFSSIGGSWFSSSSPTTATVPAAHTGGVIGDSGLFSRQVDMGVFADAPRYHSGGLVSEEVPIIAKRGERVLTAAQNQVWENGSSQTPQVNVKVNVNNNAANSQASASYSRDSNGDLTLDVMIEQMESTLSKNISKGSGLAPTLENRYGLNPARGSYG
jgi:lambda family phage tail tape measure protein